MGVFDSFRKKAELIDAQKKQNMMWKLWAEGRVDSPYAELMTYQAEINNGGHGQYFSNIENTGGLQKEMSTLDAALPAKLKSNLQDAYKAYLTSDKKETDEKAEKIMEQCDDVFYENEGEINRILKEYADKIEL